VLLKLYYYIQNTPHKDNSGGGCRANAQHRPHLSAISREHGQHARDGVLYAFNILYLPGNILCGAATLAWDSKCEAARGGGRRSAATQRAAAQRPGPQWAEH
jgi:hypothetical protein